MVLSNGTILKLETKSNFNWNKIVQASKKMLGLLRRKASYRLELATVTARSLETTAYNNPWLETDTEFDPPNGIFKKKKD